MSSPAALATVTATLQHLLSSITTTVTTQPPGTARTGTSEQINIFLYSTNYNAAFINEPMPGETRNGERASPPLPLVLKYLITAYGDGDDDISGQQLMGQAMSILHDHPLLGPSDFEGITPNSNLQQQFERVRITPDALSLDDMSKLWSSFQSVEYRLSTGYEISVVLIESNRPVKTPLPVLKRGADDQGAIVTAGLSPTLTGLRFTNQKPSAELEDTVTLLGSQLSSDDTVIRFQHPLLTETIEIQPEISQNNTEMKVQLPKLSDDAALGSKWPAGFYTVTVKTQRQDIPAWSSNATTMPLSPSIVSVDPTTAPAGDVILTIECLPQINEEQNVALLFNNLIIHPETIITPADPTARTTLTFNLENTVSKTTPYVLRLRVDGVDSIPIDFSSATPQFSTNQTVTIT